MKPPSRSFEIPIGMSLSPNDVKQSDSRASPKVVYPWNSPNHITVTLAKIANDTIQKSKNLISSAVASQIIMT